MTRFNAIVLAVFITKKVESNHENKEAQNRKESLTADAEKLIAKKQAEKAEEGMRAVQESAQGVQTEVADIMGGVEAPKEKVSERQGESGDRRDISGGGQPVAQDEGAVPIAAVYQRGLPSEEIMVKKIRTAINTQIKLEMKKAMKLQKNLSSGSAQEYNSTIARIRRLKETLASLATSAYEAIKTLYNKYFGPDGRRKNLDEL